jgi:hypothetical protein
MSDNMASEQERLVKLLAERSMSAPFVFKPMHSEIQGKELFDLAWACNNCLIVMSMQRTTVYADKEKNERKMRKSIEHNVKQSRWFLREWRSGRTVIEGENSWRKFRIKHDPAIRIVVVSVIECGEAVAAFHPDEQANLHVDCCATLPFSSLELLVEKYGSVIDLVFLLVRLRGHPPLPEIEFNSVVQVHAKNCADAAGMTSLWPNYQLDERFTRAACIVLGSRGSQIKLAIDRETPRDMRELEDIFNDFGLVAFWKLVVAIRTAIDGVAAHRSEGRFVLLYETVNLLYYDSVIICVTNFHDELMRKAGELTEAVGEEMKSGRMKPGPVILCELEFADQPMMVCTLPRSGLSAVERMLDALKSPAPSGS